MRVSLPRPHLLFRRRRISPRAPCARSGAAGADARGRTRRDQSDSRGRGNAARAVVDLRGDRRLMAAFDHAVIGAGEQQHGGGRGTGAARHIEFEQRGSAAMRGAQQRRIRSSPHMRARPRGGRRTSFQFQLQRLSDASSNIHRDRLFKRWPIMGSKLRHERDFARARRGRHAASAAHPHARTRGPGANARHCLVLGRFGKRLVKVYGLCAGGVNLRPGVANSARRAVRPDLERPPQTGQAHGCPV